MKVHYQCEFDVAHPSMVPEYLRGIIDAAIKAANLVAPKTDIYSKVEKIIT